MSQVKSNFGVFIFHFLHNVVNLHFMVKNGASIYPSLILHAIFIYGYHD